jgi:dTDP-glucose 4,6-dehydratase
MNILVTGGCGFIGSNFIRQRLLEGAGGRVVNLDKLTYAGNPANLADVAGDPRYAFVHGDIGDEALVASRLLAEHDIGAVVNFAAESHVDRSIDSPEPFVQTNVVGTLRLLNAAGATGRASAAGARESFRFLHISTDEVYGSLGPTDAGLHGGDRPSPPTPRTRPPRPRATTWCAPSSHTYGLPTLTTNCSNNYGPFHFPEKLFPLVILNALEGRPLPVYGDGQQVRDWLYVGDHCRAISLVLRARPARRDLQRGRPQRADEPRGGEAHLLAPRRPGPPQGRPALRRRRSSSSPTGPATTAATRSTARRSRELGWRPPSRSRPAWRRPSTGTSRTGLVRGHHGEALRAGAPRQDGLRRPALAITP